MTDGSIREAIAGRIDQMDSDDVSFFTFMVGMMGLVALPAIGYGFVQAFTAAPFGFATVVAVFVFGAVGWRYAAAIDEEPETDPVATLEEQLAAGEITHAEFEERLDTMLDAEMRAEKADLNTEELELDS